MTEITIPEQYFFNKIKNKCNIIFDVGLAKELYYFEQKLDAIFHCFEPSQEFIDAIKDKFSGKENIIINQLALGNEIGELTYYKDTGSMMPRTHHIQSSMSNDNIIKVPIDTLDNYCEKRNITHIDFLKIDVEGFELEVLKGSQKMLDNIDYIQFEYGGTYLDKNIKLKDIFDFLKNWNIYKLKDEGVEKILIPNENFEYSNFIATKKF